MTANVYSKLAIARKKLQEKPLKKSGYNKFSNFSYFELGDFLPRINEIFAEIGLCSVFRIEDECKSVDPDGVVAEHGKTASLLIINAENPSDKVMCSSPVAEATVKGATPIQILGSEHTYMRRYLWLEAMEITENDGMDAVSGRDSEPVPKKAQQSKKVEVMPDGTQHTVNMISPQQKHWFNTVLTREQRDAILDKLQIIRIEDMTAKQASDLMIAYQQKHGGTQE